MKRSSLSRVDPYIVIGFICMVLWGFLIYSAYREDDSNLAYKQACVTMGGTPLIGKYGTAVCLKDSVILAN